jgi:hypothetical protein
MPGAPDLFEVFLDTQQPAGGVDWVASIQSLNVALLVLIVLIVARSRR